MLKLKNDKIKELRYLIVKDSMYIHKLEIVAVTRNLRQAKEIRKLHQVTTPNRRVTIFREFNNHRMKNNNMNMDYINSHVEELKGDGK